MYFAVERIECVEAQPEHFGLAVNGQEIAAALVLLTWVGHQQPPDILFLPQEKRLMFIDFENCFLGTHWTTRWNAQENRIAIQELVSYLSHRDPYLFSRLFDSMPQKLKELFSWGDLDFAIARLLSIDKEAITACCLDFPSTWGILPCDVYVVVQMLLALRKNI